MSCCIGAAQVLQAIRSDTQKILEKSQEDKKKTQRQEGPAGDRAPASEILWSAAAASNFSPGPEHLRLSQYSLHIQGCYICGTKITTRMSDGPDDELRLLKYINLMTNLKQHSSQPLFLISSPALSRFHWYVDPLVITAPWVRPTNLTPLSHALFR